MILVQKSILTGVVRAADIDLTPEQLERWEAGELIQVVAPHLPASHREWLVNGTTPAEAVTLLGEDPSEIDTTPIPFVVVPEVQAVRA